MSRSLLVIFMLITLLCVCNSIPSEECQAFPKEKHCLIEYNVKDRWPHQVRYAYNWHTKSCFEIRWSNNCPAVAEPTTTNNFPSEKECQDQCGGWA